MDTCWIWETSCNGDQYAAWTQAIGSILALMVAIAVAYYQSYKESVRRQKDAKEDHLRQLRSIFFLANAMHQLLVDFSQRNSVTYDKPAFSESVGDFLNEIRLQPSDELDDEQRNCYFRLRRCFSEIFGHVHFGDELAFIEGHMKEIHGLVEEFRAYLKS